MAPNWQDFAASLLHVQILSSEGRLIRGREDSSVFPGLFSLITPQFG